MSANARKVIPMKSPTWPVTQHVENRARRLNDMIARVGIDPVQLVRLRQGEAYLEARKICIECHHAVTCLQWLDTPHENSEQPDFCPNFPLFDRLKREAAMGASDSATLEADRIDQNQGPQEPKL